VEGEFSASIRLVDTKTKKPVATEHLGGKTVKALREEFEGKANGFFARGGLIEPAQVQPQPMVEEIRKPATVPAVALQPPLDCPPGGRLNPSTGQCECGGETPVWSEEAHACQACPVGSTWVAAAKRCRCKDGLRWNSSAGQCTLPETFQAAGLTWQTRLAPEKMNWEAARAYCTNLSLDGGNWRLPSAEEMTALYNAKQASMELQKLPGMLDIYWSSSAFTFMGLTSPTTCSLIDGRGIPNNTFMQWNVRCVR
jgi:hypothetical protein